MKTDVKNLSKIVLPNHWQVIYFIILILIAAFGTFSVSAQVSGAIVDSLNQKPIPFANILFQNGKSGTISDIKGEFSLPSNAGDSITISSVGYHSKQLAVKDVVPNSNILLSPKTFTLESVDIFPGENPALQIMKQVVERKSYNNPDYQTNYSCIVYHKMSFDVLVPDLPQNADSLTKEIDNILRHHHLLLMESVSEKKHLAPNQSKERIISGRVSGFKDPSLAILPSQIQPFGFYKDHVTLLDQEFLNPASEAGLKNYIFILEDTIIENKDSLYYISFFPREKANIKPLQGSFHILTKTFAIKNIRAQSQIPTTPYKLEINQSYEPTKKGIWFPSQLESQLLIKANSKFNPLPFALIGHAKSLVTAINTEPILDAKEFNSIILEDDMSSNPTAIEILRYEPLNAKDSATYHLIDSIGNANRFDKLIKLQKNLIGGYIPAGPFLIDINNIIGYNQYEGLKAGMGLWSGRELTGNFSIGGYINHAFKAKHQNYGGGIKWSISEVNQTSMALRYDHSMHATGTFSFFSGEILEWEDYLKEFAVTTMDRQSLLTGHIQSRIKGSLSGRLFLSYGKMHPLGTYGFSIGSTSAAQDFTVTEIGLKLRWAPGEKLSKTAFGVLPYSGLEPKIWFNIIGGKQDLNTEISTYTKIEAQIKKEFRTGPSARTSLQFTGGWINNWRTLNTLYSYFGTFDPFSIEIPNMFDTMSPNEFAADRFVLAFINHKIPLRQNKSGTFKPELHLLSKAGWGDINNTTNILINSFNKGFFESGILLDNLFNTFLFKYGIGMHYRYGYYKKKKTIDNLSFRLSVSFSL